MSTLEHFLAPPEEKEQRPAIGLIDEIIKGLAPYLPDNSLVKYETDTVDGEFLYLANITTHEGRPVDRKAFYKLRVPVVREHKHVSQLRIKYLAHGINGMLNYIDKYWRKDQAHEMRGRILAAINGHEYVYDVSDIERRATA